MSAGTGPLLVETPLIEIVSPCTALFLHCRSANSGGAQFQRNIKINGVLHQLFIFFTKTFPKAVQRQLSTGQACGLHNLKVRQ